MPSYTSVRQSGGVDVLTSTSVIIPNRSSGRSKLILTNNDAANLITIGLATDDDVDPTASAGNGIPLRPAGGTVTLDGYAGAVAAVAAGGTTRLHIVEFW